jgi:hypothetical protein
METSPEDLTLGISAGPFELARSDALAATVLQLAGQSRRSIDIVSRHLDPVLFDQGAFIQAVKRLVLGSRRAEVRLLLLDPGPVARRGHRLLELAQFLSDFIHVRVPSPVHREFNEAWLVADATGYVYRPMSDRFEATVDFNDRHQASQLVARFNEIWERAQPDPNQRRLSL